MAISTQLYSSVWKRQAEADTVLQTYLDYVIKHFHSGNLNYGENISCHVVQGAGVLQRGAKGHLSHVMNKKRMLKLLVILAW